jgi:biopolymer transport protein ExbB
MTALGLAVAVPAVLAYNFSVRRNRMFLARLDSFAHDLFALLTTGSAVGEDDEPAIPESASSNVAPAGA